MTKTVCDYCEADVKPGELVAEGCVYTVRGDHWEVLDGGHAAQKLVPLKLHLDEIPTGPNGRKLDICRRCFEGALKGEIIWPSV